MGALEKIEIRFQCALISSMLTFSFYIIVINMLFEFPYYITSS